MLILRQHCFVRVTSEALSRHLGARRAGTLLVKNRIKVLRAEYDLMQAMLAEVLEVSRQTVNAIETGRLI